MPIRTILCIAALSFAAIVPFLVLGFIFPTEKDQELINMVEKHRVYDGLDKYYKFQEENP